MGSAQMFLSYYLNLYKEQFDHVRSVCREFTMTSDERIAALYASCHYALDNNVKGDFVECGVWRGGSAMVMFSVLKDRGVSDRRIWLYDTYEGMSPATDEDVDLNGVTATSMLDTSSKSDLVWAYAGIGEVVANLERIGPLGETCVFVKGRVEDTVPEQMPSNIAVLRLDSDWYGSTRHEMAFLYPRLASKGVLLIDDYGHWQGCKQAIDEYFVNDSEPPNLTYVDYTCRGIIKE